MISLLCKTSDLRYEGRGPDLNLGLFADNGNFFAVYFFLLVSNIEKVSEKKKNP